MSPITGLLILILAYGFGVGTGWKIDTWKNKAEQAHAIELAQQAERAANLRADEASNNFAEKLANFRVTQKTFYNETKREIEKPVYIDPKCVLPASGVELRNRAIDAANADTGQPTPTVPADPKDGSGQGTLIERLLRRGPSTDKPVRRMRKDAQGTGGRSRHARAGSEEVAGI